MDALAKSEITDDTNIPIDANSYVGVDDNAQIDSSSADGLSKMILFTKIVVMIYALAMTLVAFSTQQFLHGVISKEMHANNNVSSNYSVCTINISSPVYHIYTEIQRRTSALSLRLSLASIIPAIFTSLFLGAYSDQIGRKFLFLLPMFGCFIQSSVYAVVSYLHASLAYMYIAEIASGLTGGFYTFLIACFSFTSDSTKKGYNRSFHIAVLECIAFMCVGLAMFGAGFLIRDLGFTVTYIISSCLSIVGAILTVCLIRIPRRNASIRPDLRKLIYNIFQFYISDYSGKRIVYQLCIVAITLPMLSTATESSVKIIFLLGKPMCMNSVDIGLICAASFVASAVGSVVLVKVSQRCLNDLQIAALSAVSRVIYMVLVGLAKSKVQLYIAVATGSLGSATTPLIRAAMSKLITNHQHGALFASTASIEAIVAAVSSSIGNSIYEVTVSKFSGTVFFFIATLSGVGILMLIILDFVKRRKCGAEMVLLIDDE